MINREDTDNQKTYAVFSIVNFKNYVDGSSKTIEQNIEIPYTDIIAFLNEECDKSFAVNNEQSKKWIRARWKEGYRVQDFHTVILNKSHEWKNDLKFNQFLRPETLFGNKFASYLQAKNKRTHLAAVQKSFFED